jgi:hypothetical protein
VSYQRVAASAVAALRHARKVDTVRTSLIGLVAAMLLLTVSAACGQSQSDEGGAPSSAVGTIVDVSTTGGEVRAFTLRTNEEHIEISIPEGADYGFELEHLKEHEATGAPVLCTLEERGGRVYATGIVDF